MIRERRVSSSGRMKEIRLRHHHLLCTQTFSGKGYDDLFVANMEEVASALQSPKELLVHLSMGCDDICSSCPKAARGLCEFQDSVLEKDRSAAMFFDLPEEGLVDAGPLLTRVKERLRELDDIRLVCGECDWVELCNYGLRALQINDVPDNANGSSGPGKKSFCIMPILL